MSRQREVPQFIDIEDKIAFQLTAKQLGWVGLGAFFGFIAWGLLETFYFIMVAIIIVICLIGVIFVKPYGQELPVFIKNTFVYMFRPKVYIWRKGYQKNPPVENQKKFFQKKEKENKKRINPGDIKEVVKSLDIYE